MAKASDKEQSFEVVVDHFKVHTQTVRYKAHDEKGAIVKDVYLDKGLVGGIKSWKITFTPND